jgi:hypothetical protein
MRSPAIGILVLAIVSTVPAFTQTSKSSAKADQDAIVITFKDGHQQTFSLGDVAKIEFHTAASQPVSRIDRATLAGKWKVGTGAGMGTFYITLAADGTATKSMGSSRGTWEMVGSEARISWDDGWHDVIRKTGSRYEKAAYAPGRPLTESPSNVASAERTEPM